MDLGPGGVDNSAPSASISVETPKPFPAIQFAYANGLWIVGVDHKSHHVSNIVGRLATSRVEVLPRRARPLCGSRPVGFVEHEVPLKLRRVMSLAMLLILFGLLKNNAGSAN